MATKWFPDTCDCEVEINNGEFALLKACQHHATAAAVLAENQQKNIEVVNPLIAEFGDEEKGLPKGKAVEWERNEKGSLDYKIIGFTEQEKLTVATLITKEEILVKDESDLVIKEAIIKEEVLTPVEGEVIKGG